MQTEYICRETVAPALGDIDGDYIVINITHPFPEEGFSYDDMRGGKCPAYVRVTLRQD